METVFSAENLFEQLRVMHAPQDKIVLVHTSLHAVGKTEGRGEGFLNVLIDWFTAKGGLLCIPTHTWDRMNKPAPSLDLGNPRLDESKPLTCLGTLPNIAASDKRAVRSLNPTHSMAVFGNLEKARAFVAGEEKLETPVSNGGCHWKIADQGGYILLVGVGHNKNTFLHSVEARLGVPNRFEATPSPYRIRFANGEIIDAPMRQIHAEGIKDVSMNYPKFEPSFRRNGCITDGFLGNAPTQLCDAAGMSLVLEKIYKKARGLEILYDGAPLPSELEV